jgi:hypothetical protein
MVIVKSRRVTVSQNVPPQPLAPRQAAARTAGSHPRQGPGLPRRLSRASTGFLPFPRPERSSRIGRRPSRRPAQAPRAGDVKPESGDGTRRIPGRGSDGKGKNGFEVIRPVLASDQIGISILVNCDRVQIGGRS